MARPRSIRRRFGLPLAAALLIGGVVSVTAWVVAMALQRPMTLDLSTINAALAWLSLFGVVGWLVCCMLQDGPDAWRCKRCDYDIRGVRSGRCPECGAPIEGEP
ncbi:MAG: hypothetical protein ACKVZJ_11205 [Phycisphaerales bacterium]